MKDPVRKKEKRVSRRGFIAGLAAGGAGIYALTSLPRRIFTDPDKPAWISEFFLDNFWFDAAGVYDEPLNPPLKSKIKADIAIVGGGFTGLASAYHLIRKFPNKKIVLLESAYCGYGASGRNGGMAIPYHPEIYYIAEKQGLEAARKFKEVNAQGLELIKELVAGHGINCDLEDTGVMVLATSEKKMKDLEEMNKLAGEVGIKSRILNQQEVRSEIKSERYLGAQNISEGAIINPAKLARGMKKAVEGLGVEIFERTPVVSIKQDSRLTVNAEQGEVEAPALVFALNGYSGKLGFFKNRITPLCNYVIATEPLSPQQMQAIGWTGRQMLWDTRTEFDYFRLSADNRIVFGGEFAPYFYGAELSSGNYQPSLKILEQSLLKTFPQLAGIKITHRWGGTMAFTLDLLPGIGVTGPNKNIFYGLGYSGEGVALSQVAGKIISQLYAQEDTELTRFSLVNRKMPLIPPEPVRYPGLALYKKYLTIFD